MSWLWFLIGSVGVLFIGQGLLMVLWSFVEALRLVIFGTGIEYPDGDSRLAKVPAVRRPVKQAKFDNGGN